MIVQWLTTLGAVLAGFLLGSLPLGSYLVRFLSGKDVRHLSAHNLGVENLLRALGVRVALASFFLDLLKGFLLVLAFPTSPWAALGVFFGHLYPLPQFVRGDPPRGRGNGVLIGILAAWSGLGVPWYVVALPVILYAALVAYWGYVSLATLLALLSLLMLSLLTPSTALSLTCLGLLLLSLWRHKASVARLIEGLEPRLDDPPPVFDFDPDVIPLAFMIHPLSFEDFWQSLSFKKLKPLVSLLPETWLKALLPRLRPQVHGLIEGITLKDGRKLRVLLIGGPMLPEQIRQQPEAAVRMAIQGARLAQWQGAQVMGLGAFWSTVGNKGQAVQDAVPGIAITNGGAYTAATIKAAIPGLLKAFEREGGKLRHASAAVVGANGVVAFGIARTVASELAQLILIGKDETRLLRSAETLKRKFPDTDIQVSINIKKCAEADLVFSATSDPDPVIYPEHVKPGAWLFDLGRPADLDVSVRSVPGIHIIPGGVVKPPGEMQSNLDIHFGDGLIPACLAESMIMAAAKAYDRASLGEATKTANIEFYLEEAANLGFEVITRDQYVKEVVML
ncbi:MAG: glycerol-3-phosphate acyltransferase [Trueperaceae bacterium]|nr:glycerol-3-phosphate acyltransferase [Trueperaceae bacterium]